MLNLGESQPLPQRPITRYNDEVLSIRDSFILQLDQLFHITLPMTSRQMSALVQPLSHSLQSVALERLAQVVTDGQVIEVFARKAAFAIVFDAALVPAAEVHRVFAVVLRGTEVTLGRLLVVTAGCSKLS